jgi:hypothetical protein
VKGLGAAHVCEGIPATSWTRWYGDSKKAALPRFKFPVFPYLSPVSTEQPAEKVTGRAQPTNLRCWIIKLPAFEFFQFESASTMFWWDQGSASFRRVALSD